MAKLTLRKSHHLKPAHAYGIFALFVLVHVAAATEFRVGGANGWTLPPNPNFNPYIQWAEMNRFQLGDSLLFIYPPNKDSVLQVTMEKYKNCVVDGPIASFKDGNTLVTFNQSGPHYFISGTNGNCLKNEKMLVIVMAERGNVNRSSTSNNTKATPPASAPVLSPPEISPSTPPEMNPSTPPEMVPATAPTGEASPSPPSPPPGNGASSLPMISAASVGALFGTSILLSL
ncbi:early nodulin-like protein 9 [Aristolochia californica]|uniref:early nodulin-like protein 9 n=1 Tax=Aristolochia californica TaxID=171875 RepID=UPI0035DDDC91